jgi:quinol monooxygenase YgiN
MSAVHVFATVSAAAGKADELREVLKTLVAATKEEPGVVHYILHEDPTNLGSFYVFEVYKDKAAMDSHMGSAHLAAAFAAAGPIIAGPPSIVPTVVVAGS